MQCASMLLDFVLIFGFQFHGEKEIVGQLSVSEYYEYFFLKKNHWIQAKRAYATDIRCACVCTNQRSFILRIRHLLVG